MGCYLAPRIWIITISLIFVASQEIDEVHVVFMNHLDVGYDGISPEIGYVYNVMNKYFDVYFPLAIETAITMESDFGFKYIYTTHPWLVSMYLDCPPGMKLHCPTSDAISNFEDAVNKGYIAWHAGPFNAESEIMSPDLFQYGISISHELDSKFGKNLTFTMSQRDVPGLTRAVIPLLNASGIQALSVGVNGLSAPPVVPKAFLWKDETSETEIIAMFHPYGYGGITRDDAVIVPGLSHALVFAFNGDNAGPQTWEEVLEVWSQVQLEFPEAKIRASTFDEFVTQLATVRNSLPVVTSEIGDTWIHGVASDPLKLAIYRQVLEARSECIANQICDENEYNFRNFSRFLIKVAEHTWGLTSSAMFYSFDWTYWTNHDFQTHRDDQNFQNMETSWYEQRSFIDRAIEALGSSKADLYLKQDISNRISALFNIQPPSTDGYTRITDFDQIFDCGLFTASFDGNTGAISYLLQEQSRTQWASKENLLGIFQYQTYNEDDFNSFLDAYSPCRGLDACEIALTTDFSKLMLQFFANPKHQTVVPSLVSFWMKQDVNGTHFLSELSLEDDVVSNYGAPPLLWISFDFNASQPEIDVNLKWFNKTTTRLPGLFFTFNPIQQFPQCSWFVQKLGELIDTNDVVVNGSNHLHAVQSALSCIGPEGIMFVNTDAALACIGSPNPFPVPLVGPPDESQGVSFLLYNNIWNTNYILWYPYSAEDANSMFRFSMLFPSFKK